MPDELPKPLSFFNSSIPCWHYCRQPFVGEPLRWVERNLQQWASVDRPLTAIRSSRIYRFIVVILSATSGCGTTGRHTLVRNLGHSHKGQEQILHHHSIDPNDVPHSPTPRRWCTFLTGRHITVLTAYIVCNCHQGLAVHGKAHSNTCVVADQPPSQFIAKRLAMFVAALRVRTRVSFHTTHALSMEVSFMPCFAQTMSSNRFEIKDNVYLLGHLINTRTFAEVSPQVI